MKKIVALALVVSMMAGMAITTNAAAVEEKKVGALADSYTAGSGTFTMTSNSRIFVVAETEPTGELLQTAQLIHRQFNADKSFSDLDNMEFVWGEEAVAKTGDVILKLDTASGIGADGYKLEVSDKAVVTAADTDGLIYGANMLQKYFDAKGGVSLAGFTASDTPDTKERTVMLDTGRKYYTAEWVCNFIKQMSWMEYNALEVHFSEDGGYRADLWDPTYYKGEFQPENDFSWLCGSYVQSWVKDPYREDPNAGDYLTTEELVRICEVAKEYHIEIIPSFDSPAHMDYITWQFEQHYESNNNYYFSYGGKDYYASASNGCINYTGRTGADSPTWPYYTTIDITDGTVAKAFVFALYEDMADFFKEYAGSTKFNIGADEVNLSSSYGPKWGYSQFPGYVNELNRMLNSKGYTTRMFNDFIGSTTYNRSNSKAVYDFDDNIEIVYWNSDFNPTEGTWSDPTWHVKFFWENNTGSTDNWGDGGRTMYNAIQTNCYYVLREGTSGTHRDARDPNNRNWTFYGTNEADIYNKWYPADISEKGVYTENAADVPAEQLGGAYFLIWNDYAALNTEEEVWEGALDCWDKDVTYYLFDIMYSNIIKMWNSDINDSVDYSNFAAVRDSFNDFPGFTECSKAANLPAASAIEQAPVADHTSIKEALANKVSNTDGKYTAGSYEAYEAAYQAAVEVDNNAASTKTQLNDAIEALNNAKAALVDLSALNTATATKIENNVDVDYTASSYAAYEAAYEAALAVKADRDATPEEIASAIANLEVAEKNLKVVVPGQVEEVDSPYILTELMAKHFKSGKMVGFKVTTLQNQTLNVLDDNGNAIECTKYMKDQIITDTSMDDEGKVTIWLVKFPTPGKGGHRYTITTGTHMETIDFEVK